MTTNSLRNVRLGACAAWLTVAGYGAWELLVESDDWELAYGVFEVALAVGAALTLVLLSASSRSAGRRSLRAVGLAVGGLGVAAAFVGAWALPLWMTILGVGFALVALASDGGARRPVAFLAAAQFVGIAVQLSTLRLGVDEDLAANGALMVTAVATAIGLVRLFGHLGNTVPGDGSAGAPALGIAPS